jgi:hypothetical protein
MSDMAGFGGAVVGALGSGSDSCFIAVGAGTTGDDLTEEDTLFSTSRLKGEPTSRRLVWTSKGSGDRELSSDGSEITPWEIHSAWTKSHCQKDMRKGRSRSRRRKAAGPEIGPPSSKRGKLTSRTLPCLEEPLARYQPGRCNSLRNFEVRWERASPPLLPQKRVYVVPRGVESPLRSPKHESESTRVSETSVFDDSHSPSLKNGWARGLGS